MKTSEKQKQLLQKYLQNTCSPQEFKQLLHYFLRADQEQELLNLIRQQLEIVPDDEQDPAVEAKLKQAFAQIKAGIAQAAPYKRIRIWKWVAAAIIIIMGTLAAVLHFIRIESKEPVSKTASAKILPGYNQATLTLADGREIPLDSSQAGIIINNEKIKYTNGNPVELTPLREVSEALSNDKDDIAVEMLALSTPRGGQYQIILPDGTKVWLNAASTLKYPSFFTGNKRVVYLTGEGYFSVSSQGAAGGKNRFVVISKGQEINVLSTEFNISSYEDDPVLKTTLVSGAVGVTSFKSISGHQRAAIDYQELRPGQQSLVSNGKIRIKTIQAGNETSWKNDRFSFNDEPLENIMRQLSRWYDISVQYQGTIPNELYNGTISRKKTMEEVLAMLSATQTVTFTIHNKSLPNGKQERRVVVK